MEAPDYVGFIYITINSNNKQDLKKNLNKESHSLPYSSIFCSMWHYGKQIR